MEASQQGQLTEFLVALGEMRPEGRAELAAALPRLVRRVPRGARVLLISDLLSRAEPGCLHALAGRGLRGALLHLRVPEVTAPEPCGLVSLRDVETGETKTVVLDAALAARVAARAKAHAERWAAHAGPVGLRYLPFAPSTSDEVLLRRLVEDLP